MIYDLRTRQVPNGLSITGLFGAGLLCLLQGIWIPALMTAGLICISDLDSKKIRLALGVLLTTAFILIRPESFLLCFSILGIWVMWELGLFGGADVKLLFSVLLVCKNPFVLIPIMVTGGIQGVIASFRKKKEIPFVLSIFFGTLFFYIYPCFQGSEYMVVL